MAVTKTAQNLVYHPQETVWASDNQPFQWFELFFPNHFIELKDYTFMATANDDEIPRSWSVFCLDNNQNFTLATEIDQKALCDGKTGFVECGIYDQKSFPTTNQKLCQRIRFMQTGLNSCGKNHFVLSGVELFGRFFILSSFTCLTHTHVFHLFSLLFVVLN